MTRVINFYGGPGSGKSLTAIDLFSRMKKLEAGIKVELVTEYAKEVVYSDMQQLFKYQEIVFAEQRYRIERLVDKVDYIITDSPINLGHFYMPEGKPYDYFRDFVDSCFDLYTNTNFFVNRIHPYEAYGRDQTEEQAKAIDQEILSFLRDKNIPYDRIDPDDRAIDTILEHLGLNK